MPRPKREPINPTLDVTTEEAFEDLRGDELDFLERKYGKGFEKWTAKETLTGIVFMYERRAQPKLAWADVNIRPFRELNGYFVQAEAADPEEGEFRESAGTADG